MTNTPVGFSILGLQIGFFPKVSFSLDILEPYLQVGVDLNLYRGYYFEFTKGVSLSNNGFSETKWEVKLKPISENPKINKDTLVDFLENTKLQLTPGFRIDVFVSLMTGLEELTRLGIYLLPKVPIEFGFDVTKCAFPYLYGSIEAQVAIGFYFAGLKVGKWQIIKEYENERTIYESPNYKKCLLDPDLRRADKSAIFSTKVGKKGDVYPSKSFTLEEDKDIKFVAQKDATYAYVADINGKIEILDEINANKDDKKAISGKTSEFQFIGEILKITKNSASEKATKSFTIPLTEPYVVIQVEIPCSETIDAKVKPNMILPIHIENYVPISKNEEFCKYYFMVSITENMYSVSCNKAIIKIPARRRNGKSEKVDIDVFPIIFQKDVGNTFYKENEPLVAYPSTIAFPGCHIDHDDFPIGAVSDNGIHFTPEKVEIFTAYYIIIEKAAEGELVSSDPMLQYKYRLYQSCYIIPENVYPAVIPYGALNWAAINGHYIGEFNLQIKCDRAQAIFVTINGQEYELEKDTEYWKIDCDNYGETLTLRPLCKEISQSYCEIYQEFNPGDCTMLEYPNTEGIIPLDNNENIGVGFYRDVVLGDSAKIAYWKKWEGEVKVVAKIPYMGAHNYKIVVNKIRSPGQKKELVKINIVDKQGYSIHCPILANRGNLASGLTQIGFPQPPSGWNPDNLEYAEDGALYIDIDLDKGKNDYSPLKVGEIMGFSTANFEKVEEEIIQLPVRTPIKYPPATKIPKRTPMRTPLNFKDDDAFNEDELILNGDPDNEKPNMKLIIIAVVAVVVVVVAVVVGVFVYRCIKKKRDANGENAPEV